MRPARLLRSVLPVLVSCVLCLPGPAARAEDAPKVAGTDVPPPKRTKLVLPEYPIEAQEKGLHGIVILEVLIDTEGRVAEAKVIRSIPPFDEPALAAVKKWEYEVTRVGGAPVRVLLTVPITFALRVPEVSRQEGIPELRGGLTPLYPKGGKGSSRVALNVTLDADGRISDAELLSGESPFREAVLTALRTWRFAAPEPRVQISFRIETEFEAERRGAPDKVSVRLSGLRRSEAVAGGEAPSPTPPAVAPPAAAPPAIAPPATAPPAAAPTPTAAPAPETTTPTAAPSPSPTPAAAPPGPLATPAPAPPTPPPSTTPAAPPMEVLTAPPPPRPAPRPPVAGSSAVENVTLGIGVPDLATGRRPVLPPLARMSGATGKVEVRFAVNAAGATSVLNVDGTELFKAAAQGAVSSWAFRRTTTERLYLTAVFAYEADSARATVAPTPEAAPVPPAAAADAPAPSATPAPEPSPAPPPSS
jgi:TonB family protein